MAHDPVAASHGGPLTKKASKPTKRLLVARIRLTLF